MPVDQLGDMRLFSVAAQQGSLTEAGRRLGLSPAAASARLAKLEDRLGTVLLDRTTRRLRLTDEGRTYLQHCQIALQAIDDADRALEVGRGLIRGKLRVSVSTDFGRALFNQWMQEFADMHPELVLALTLTDSISNFQHDDVDVAIRWVAPKNDALVSKRLAPNWRVLCASPAYLQRNSMPQTVDDLARHRFIVLQTAGGPLNEYHFECGGRRRTFTVPMDSAWETNDSALARAWAIAGRGITRKIIWDAAPDLHGGNLQVVLPECIAEEAGVFAVLPRSRYVAPRIRALLGFLSDRFQHSAKSLLANLPGPSCGTTARHGTP